jgi:hypothetical protein
VHQAFDVDARCDDVIGIEVARLHQMLDFRHGRLAGRGHHRIEVARGLAVDEVALGVTHPGVNDRKVGDDPAFQNIARAVDFALLLALCDQSAGSGAGEKCRDAGAARADALGQGTLRIEFDLEFAGQVLLREGLVLPDIGRDHFLDLPGVEKEAETDAIDPRIVRDHRQILDPRLADGQNQGLRDTAKSEPPGHDQHAVPQQAGERCLGVGIDLVHAFPAWIKARRCEAAAARQPAEFSTALR